MITKKLLVLIILSALNISGLNAEVLEKAELIFKINLKKAPTSRPQTVAYIPVEKKYYIADGGLAPMGSATEAPISKSLIHTYDETGKYIESTRAGFDNRSIYFNQKEARLETISYNVSSAGGFAPMTGIFSLDLDDNGLLTGKSSSISGFAAAMGSAGTMPSFDSKNNIYYAKQERTNEVFVVDAKTYKLIETIKLDFTKPNVEHHDVASHFVAYTEKKNEELILLDVDHKRFLVYDKKGNYKGESKLPKTLKIRAQNHFNGLGYTLNGYYFLYIDSEGEHGSYHAYKVLN
jgi:DNA-binding beta-propeller fold protein YncE|tara:strand:- start:106 stop:981 length:876 start_codon:yes stop_codon:yes gene_type:complete